MNKLQLSRLVELSEVCGISGFEGPVKALLKKRLGKVARVSYDKLGSIIFTQEGGKDALKIMLASHMDEVGFLVKYITKEGFLRFYPIGGWFDQVCLSQRVILHGKKGDLTGVIGSKPPHLMPAAERTKVVEKKDMYIDIGAASDKEARELGVYEGCPVTPDVKVAVLGKGNILAGKAWDNRIGCAIMADVMENLAKKAHASTVYGVGTVQEEVGLRGAQTSANMLAPDIAFVLDTCAAGGTPGVTDDFAPAKMGQGIGITIFDGGILCNTALKDLAVSTAKKLKVPVQIAYGEGGTTDGARIHLTGAGVLTLVFSVPTRYIHSHQSVIDVRDYEAAVKLITALCVKLDRQTYTRLLEA
mgnify:CR=1 FL=1